MVHALRAQYLVGRRVIKDHLVGRDHTAYPTYQEGHQLGIMDHPDQLGLDQAGLRQVLEVGVSVDPVLFFMLQTLNILVFVQNTDICRTLHVLYICLQVHLDSHRGKAHHLIKAPMVWLVVHPAWVVVHPAWVVVHPEWVAVHPAWVVDLLEDQEVFHQAW